MNESLGKILESARKGELVVVIGAGVSTALTNGSMPPWKGLIEKGFEFGVMKGKISKDQNLLWGGQIKSNDIDDLLGAAEFMQRKLGGQGGDLYARWLENIFKDKVATNSEMVLAVKAIQDFGIPMCTLNYDHLLENITGLAPLGVKEKVKLTGWMRRENDAILHLHGSWENPGSCILGIVDYDITLQDEVRKLIQQSLGAFKRLLFIGCGETFTDPNFSALIKWTREHLGVGSPQHYALVRDSEMEGRNSDASWHGFVDPVSYGAEYENLSEFLINIFSKTPSDRVKKGKTKNNVLAAHSKVLDAYRNFLLRDCGQMTIEGVRADMDTAQRKFDLERLFVPLELQAIQPHIPAHDPNREEKLLAWSEKNKSPIPFSKLFLKNKKLALLALPGGGKTILLKRLAVAYADSKRRGTCSDDLPNLNIMPVVIRCRDWREYIRRPLLSMMQNIVEITGNPELEGIHEALIPLLKKGQILLLIDGLDEIHDDGDRSTFVGNLETFLDVYKNIRLVITSREAGFSLVAPTLARFCTQWRIAPLNKPTIRMLCDYWHLLMSDNSGDAIAESAEVADRILGKDSLHRLAETPLLLTMLLVVKHGYGRLPPDRVSLYDRAVEVLLDTWNIRGHQALDPKEAVPQLAYVAFQMMMLKQQTVTEGDLLRLLTEAREKVPQIGLYAKDTPHAFLNRVELRSSLLVEAGRQLEGGKIVRFYQFRHLTFQEYLAAVAAAEGHFPNYKEGNTVLTPVQSFLKNEEWKEVIPMAAVLAKKRAEPIISALVVDGQRLFSAAIAGKNFPGKKDWLEYPGRLPGSISRLVQCLAEEAQAIPATLKNALKLIAYFAKGCRTQDDWIALSRGPYSAALLHEVWTQYSQPIWGKDSKLANTFTSLLMLSKSTSYYSTEIGLKEIKESLADIDSEKNAKGLMMYVGGLWDNPQDFSKYVSLDDVRRHLSNRKPGVWGAAAWVIGLVAREFKEAPLVPSKLFDELFHLWMEAINGWDIGAVEFALGSYLGMNRSDWHPQLNENQMKFLLNIIGGEKKKGFDVPSGYSTQAALMVIFHAKNNWSDQELIEIFDNSKKRLILSNDGISFVARRMLEQLGPIGKKYLKENLSKKSKNNI